MEYWSIGVLEYWNGLSGIDITPILRHAKFLNGMPPTDDSMP
jgi:hypothetical protein